MTFLLDRSLVKITAKLTRTRHKMYQLQKLISQANFFFENIFLLSKNNKQLWSLFLFYSAKTKKDISNHSRS